MSYKVKSQILMIKIVNASKTALFNIYFIQLGLKQAYAPHDVKRLP